MLEKMCLHVFVCNKEVSVEHVAVREYSKECCNCPVRMCFLDVLFKKKKKDDDFSFRGMSQKEPQRRVKREIGEESTNGI